MIFMDPLQDVTIRFIYICNKWATVLEAMTLKIQKNGMLGKNRGKKEKRHRKRKRKGRSGNVRLRSESEVRVVGIV